MSQANAEALETQLQAMACSRTQAAVPYLDPTGQGTAAEIQEQRRQQQQSSGQLSTSAWRRRWQQGEGLRNAGRFPPS
ncbi:MAG: hypothetical protein ACPF98_03410 [Prochlorococcaceae cyanobacterium]